MAWASPPPALAPPPPGVAGAGFSEPQAERIRAKTGMSRSIRDLLCVSVAVLHAADADRRPHRVDHDRFLAAADRLLGDALALEAAVEQLPGALRHQEIDAQRL